MEDSIGSSGPQSIDAIWQDTVAAGFTMPSDHKTGSLLCTLAASRPRGRLLELGTGTGLSAAWILHGMDVDSTLDSVDNDPTVIAIARRHLDRDSRLQLHIQDGADFLAHAPAECYDLIFADAWPGKYSDLDPAISALKTGGLYIIDDMLPQPNWPDGHSDNVRLLCGTLESRTDLRIAKLNWSTGVIIASKVT